MKLVFATRLWAAVIGTALCSVAFPGVKSAQNVGTSSSIDKEVVAAADVANADRRWHSTHGVQLRRMWGIDIVSVRPVSSGYMLAFTYRVLDAKKAAPLMEKTNRPYLIDEVTGARLAVPAMENVGELRQAVAPQSDRNYYMIFGNPGKLVQPGGRVSVVIGNFRADGLTVD